MICNKCSNEIDDNVIYCPFCGTKVNNNVIDIVEEEVKEVKEKGPWRGFANVGFILGIISLCTFWLLGFGTYCGVFGIVFSCLGRKSTTKHAKANLGFKRSLTGTILSLGFVTLIYLISLIINIVQRYI